jgi:Ca2+-binding EF-hand superfamily protein
MNLRPRSLVAGLLSLALLLAALVAAPAADKVVPPRPGQGETVPGSPSDVQTLAYIGEARPVLIRLHVLIDGKSPSAAWDDFMQKLFDYCDVNNDGTLSKDEAVRVPSVDFLRAQASGIIRGFRGTNNNAPFDQLDANKDGKVTPDEFKAYYRKVNFGSFAMRVEQGQGKSGQLTDALFKHLDTNKDGKLSKEEFAAAETLLHKLDLDEDEMISQDELMPDLNPYGRYFFGVDPMEQGPANPSFQLLSPGESPSKVAKAILDRFDKGKKGKLTAKEVGFDEATFARLDANKDGVLDAGELEKWVAGPSDLELTVRLGNPQPRRKAGGLLGSLVEAGRGTESAGYGVEVSPGTVWPLAGEVRSENNGVRLTHGIAQIDVRGALSARGRRDTRQFYIMRFQGLLKDKKDYIEKADAMNEPFLGGLFVFADRDGDGKLYEKELNAFFDVMAGVNNAFATMSLADHGTGLFELMDANRDGRLSVREMRTAWDRVAVWDKAKAGAVTREQIPRQFELTLQQGPADDPRFRGVPFGRVPPRPAESGRGPVWFRKMDRNGDGDVSRKEWLGSPEDFDKIDADHDGLISVEEAERYDALMRQKERK